MGLDESVARTWYLIFLSQEVDDCVSREACFEGNPTQRRVSQLKGVENAKIYLFS